MQLDQRDGLLLRRCEIDREGEHEDRGDEEQGQPVQEPDHRVENVHFRIAIDPQHPDTSVSSPTGPAGGRSNRAGVYSHGPYVTADRASIGCWDRGSDEPFWATLVHLMNSREPREVLVLTA